MKGQSRYQRDQLVTGGEWEGVQGRTGMGGGDAEGRTLLCVYLVHSSDSESHGHVSHSKNKQSKSTRI